MSLSDTAIKNAKPQDKPYKIADDKGMYLLVNPNGSKYFRLDYRYNKKRLRCAEWEHIDLNAKEWRYLVTKTNTPHIVPLSDQSIVILEAIKPLTGKGRFVFPSARTPNGSRPLSDAALLVALRSMGYDKDTMTIHGFRAMAKTMLQQQKGLKYRPDFVEHQLAHAVKDPNGRAYDRTSYLEDRHEMMQTWADYLDQLKVGAVVIPFVKSA